MVQVAIGIGPVGPHRDQPVVGSELHCRVNVVQQQATSLSDARPARPTLAPGHTLGDYREVVLGQDLGFAWHHVQFWAECFEARFAIPLVGDVGTLAYYVEAKYKFTPQFSGAGRWNQQQFDRVRAGDGEWVPWGSDVWRIDVAPSYRFTPHTEGKLQFSLQHNAVGRPVYARLVAVQFVVRF